MENFSNFGSLKSTETRPFAQVHPALRVDFSNFGSLKSTETALVERRDVVAQKDFSNFGSLKSTETCARRAGGLVVGEISAISAR